MRQTLGGTDGIVLGWRADEVELWKKVTAAGSVVRALPSPAAPRAESEMVPAHVEPLYSTILA